MELPEYFRFVLALAFVLGLIGLLALVAKRYGPGMAGSVMTKGRKKRLKLVEMMMLDGKRRAVIIRRDDVDHLVILGPNSETVVETGITPPPETPLEINNKNDAENKTKDQH